MSIAVLITGAGKLMLACVCAAVVGWERERQEKAAGIRTHILICIGSCLFMVVGLELVDPTKTNDVLRIFQGVITGVGFVGAGAIIREGGDVKGLTTAAGVWVISAIGLAVGAGEYLLAVFSSVMVVFVMRFIGHLSIREHKVK